MPNFIKNISSTELILLAVIFVLLFGAKTFISLGKTAGQSFKEIKKIKKSITEAVDIDESDKNKEGGA